MCLRYANRIRKWKFLMLLGLIMMVAFMRAIWSSLRPDPLPLSEFDKCPACYGVSVCDEIVKGNIKITPFGLYSAIAHVIASKNVFFGTMGQTRVVLKKLAHSYELRALDEIICGNKSFSSLCPGHRTNTKYESDINFRSLVVRAITSSFLVPDASSLRLCPNAHHFDELFANVYANGVDHKDVYLWTLISVNPEPLVLQILPAEDGWPVPKYLGACGRLVVVEYIGSPLSAYYEEPWIRRAKIAASLLEAAKMFTFRNPDFGFYLTDLSPDNIAVTENDEAKFIDLENIIIVDKNVSFSGKKQEASERITKLYEPDRTILSHLSGFLDRTATWDQMQANDESIECRNCLAFSPEDICHHRLSDHNYYAICQHILSDKTSATSVPGGFLHSVPIEILEKYSDLIDILDQCAVPVLRRYERTMYGDKLKEILDKIVKDTG